MNYFIKTRTFVQFLRSVWNLKQYLRIILQKARTEKYFPKMVEMVNLTEILLLPITRSINKIEHISAEFTFLWLKFKDLKLFCFQKNAGILFI